MSEGSPLPTILMRAKSELICPPPTTETLRLEARDPLQSRTLSSGRGGRSLAKGMTPGQAGLPLTWTESRPKPRFAAMPIRSGNETVCPQISLPSKSHPCRENQRTLAMAVTCSLSQERTKQRGCKRRTNPDDHSYIREKSQRRRAMLFAVSSTMIRHQSLARWRNIAI